MMMMMMMMMILFILVISFMMFIIVRRIESLLLWSVDKETWMPKTKMGNMPQVCISGVYR